MQGKSHRVERKMKDLNWFFSKNNWHVDQHTLSVLARICLLRRKK